MENDGYRLGGTNGEPSMLALADHPTLNAISLFSGAGGMDVGLKSTGFNVVLANDIDPDACESYRKNHGEHIVEGSVHAVLPLLDHVGAIDLVFGGPPCQGFSVAGKMNPDDERSQLMFTFFDAVMRVRPKAFICENVKAFAELGKWSAFRQGVISAAESAYFTKMVVLNASQFGVPQNRERMFLLGVDKDRFPGSQEAFEKLVDDALEEQKASPETVGDIVRRLGRPGSSSNPRTCSAKVTFANNPIMRRSPYAGMLFNGAGRPLPVNGVSSTLPASMGGNKTPIVDDAEIFDGATSFVDAYHADLVRGEPARRGNAPARLRRLTVDECLAIQTFPADYVLSGKRSAQYRQIGNAVPCKLAGVVGKVARSAIEMIFAEEAAQLWDRTAIAAE